MKKILLMLLLIVSIGSVMAQRKPAPKPANAVPASPKPKGPVPYVVKKDYDSTMLKMTNQIGGMQRSFNSIKDNQINSLESKMAKVEEVLNSTNFKMSLTSDSLSQTRVTFEEVQKNHEAKFANIEADLANQKKTNKLLYLIIAIALILPIIVWFLLNKKIQELQKNTSNNHLKLESSLDLLQVNTEKKTNDLDQAIRTESRMANNNAERLNTSMKEELTSSKNDWETVKSAITILAIEISDLNEKIKNKEV
jgi:hypothetical protein